jgi:hypothetical protein
MAARFADGFWATLCYLWRLDTRSAEFALGLLLLIRGAVIFSPGEAMAGPVYAPYLAFAPELVWGTVTILGGGLIVSGIVINGRVRRSPYLRLTGTFVACVMLTCMTVSFALLSPNEVSIAAFGTYLPLLIVAIWSGLNIAARAP